MVDAVLRVRVFVDAAATRSELVLAVSLDIANAFNYLPWSCIKEALTYHRVLQDICRIIANYLSNVKVIFQGQTDRVQREMSCGDPQGSVLGPFLWNIGYDRVLRGVNFSGVNSICYDDILDTRGQTHREAVIIVATGVAHTFARIWRLVGTSE